MRVVVSLAVALTLAVYLSAMAANSSTSTSNNGKTSGAGNTSGSVNTASDTSTSNNSNASNNANSGSTNTSNNTSTSGSTGSSNNTGSSNSTGWNGNGSSNGSSNNTGSSNGSGTWNGSNTSGGNSGWNNGNTSNSSGSSNYAGGWNGSNSSSTQELLKVSNDGFAAIRAIRAARVAIFNGHPTYATKMLNRATANLNAAAKDAPTFVATSETSVGGRVVAGAVEAGRVNWIPIDGQVSLADTYVVTKDKNQHIQKANTYFQNGNSKQAIEELRLAAISVTCTRVMMPLAATTNWVSTATKLIGQHKYYEANLALRAAEDGLVVNSTNLVEMPHVNTQRVPHTN